MAHTCRLLSFCSLVLLGATTSAKTPRLLSESSAIIASAQVSRPIGLSEAVSVRAYVDKESPASGNRSSSWYLHSIHPESVLLELSCNSTHLFLESSQTVTLEKALASITVTATGEHEIGTVVISLTTTAD